MLDYMDCIFTYLYGYSTMLVMESANDVCGKVTPYTIYCCSFI